MSKQCLSFKIHSSKGLFFGQATQPHSCADRPVGGIRVYVSGCPGPKSCPRKPRCGGDLFLSEEAGVRSPHHQVNGWKYWSISINPSSWADYRVWVGIWGSSWDLFPRTLIVSFLSSLTCPCFREGFLRRWTRRWCGGEPAGEVSQNPGEQWGTSSKAMTRLPVTMAWAVVFERGGLPLIPSLLQTCTLS